MLTLRAIVLWLHVGSVVVWVGGLVVVSLMIVPALTRDAERAQVGILIVRRFQRVSRELIFFVLLTGIVNLIYVAQARGFRFGDFYIAVLAVKIATLVSIAGIQAWYTFRLVPRLASPMGANPRDEDTRRLRTGLVVTALLILVLAMSAIFLGLGLRYV